MTIQGTLPAMNFQVISCNHHQAGLNVREQLAFSSPDALHRAYLLLKQNFPASEAVVISTCNRVEVYAAQPDDHQAVTTADLARFLSDFHQIPLESFAESLLQHTGSDAVKHLFEVASSLDSMVLGEPQIVNQVKEAYELAQQNESCGPLTHLLFQGAIRVSSRVRTETKLSEGRVSIASVAVGDFARSIFDRFDDKLVLIIGAGEMAEETLRYLKDEGVQKICVVNRSQEKAEQLAAEWGGSAYAYDQLDHWLTKADVIVSTTGATAPIVTVDHFRTVRKTSGSHPVFILDLGAPRDFSPGVGEIDENIFLYDIDDLEATCEANRKKRRREVNTAETIIDEETEKFMRNLNHRATGPIIQQLRDEWHLVKENELHRLAGKLPHLAEEDLQQVRQTIDRVINKLLHPPLEVIKDEARKGSAHGLIDALKRLFHLPD